MRVVLSTDPPETDKTQGLHVYNALDCCITLEVLEVILPQLDEVTSKTYDFERSLQAPILEMECRGVRIDRARIGEVREKLQKDLAYLQEGFNELCIDGLGILPVNPNSPKQLMELFYGTLALPPVKSRKSDGSYKPSVDRKALEKLRTYFYAEPLVNYILGIRDISKKLGVLNTGLDADGRMRTSYNIAGTDTGRLNSYESSFGSGTNLQNITDELREIFIPDKGKKLAYIDRAQIQSRIVGAICWNLGARGEIDCDSYGTYLDFCESGDLHTGVCMMTWQDKPWKGSGLEALKNPDNYIHNRAIAEEHFYRVDSFRQASKKLGHATNFLGKPPQVSLQTRIPVDLVKDFQPRYFKGFPEIPAWHRWLTKKLLKDGFITTMAGRRRHFFGRRFADETVRQAAAYEPQDVEAYINQTGMLQLWRAHIPHVDILIPVHDAIIVQYPENAEDELIPKILEAMKVEIPLMNGRSLVVPNDVQVGWNWGHASKSNPDGLQNYKGTDTRRRTAASSVLDRRVY